MRRILLIYPGGLGDILFSRVVLASLKHHYPEVKIDYAGMPQYLHLLSEELYQIIDYNDRRLLPLFSPSSALNKECLTWLNEYDGIIFWSSAQLTEHVTQKLNNLKKPAVISASVTPLPNQKEHVALIMLRTIARWGIKPTAERLHQLAVLQPNFPVGVNHPAMKMMNNYIVVHPGSGSKKKNWPISQFLKLMPWLEQQFHTRVVCILGPAETNCHTILNKTNCHWVAPKDVFELADWLKGAQFYLGNDSGVTHLAAQLGCQTFVLFVSTNPVHWRPLGQNVFVITNYTPVANEQGFYFCPDLTITNVATIIQQNIPLRFSTTAPNKTLPDGSKTPS